MHLPSRTWLAAILLAALLPCGGCKKEPRPYSVLLIVVDALRADAVGSRGAVRSPTPNLDALAQRALVFRRAYSVSSWTHPAVAAILAGRSPTTFQPGAKSYIAAEHPTLAELLRAHGYRTAAFVANPMMDPELGFGRGFETYRGYGPWVSGLAPLENKATAGTVADDVLAWLAAQKPDRPWFAYVHFMDPHWPYEPSMTHLGRFWKGDLPSPEAVSAINTQVRARQAGAPILALARHLYHASVAEVDEAIGRLLRFLDERGLNSEAVVCVTADHGEEFGEHGGVLHARTLYEEVIRVPLMLAGPGFRPATYDVPVSTQALAPTLAGALGFDSSVFASSPLNPGSSGSGQLVRAELFPFPPSIHHWAVVDGADKLLRAIDGSLELYDLNNDPSERENRAALEASVVRRLHALADHTSPSPPRSVDPAQRERMRALGYDF